MHLNRYAKTFLVVSSIAMTHVLCAASDQDRFKDTIVKAHPAGKNVYMLTGAGGNIGVSVGADGTLIVDDQFLPLADRISSAINEQIGRAHV